MDISFGCFPDHTWKRPQVVQEASAWIRFALTTTSNLLICADVISVEIILGWRNGPSRLCNDDDWIITVRSVKRMQKGFPRFLKILGKSRIFLCKISRPWKVLESSGIFLGYDVGGGHNDAGADAKICLNKLGFYLYIWKDRRQPDLCHWPHSNCCLSLYFNIAGLRQGPGKMLLGSWKVLEIFVTKRVRMLCKAVTWDPIFKSS